MTIPITDARYYAVLSGDIVESRRLTPDQLIGARAVIAEKLAEFSAQFPDQLIGKPEFFRGDSWEALLGHPYHALNLSLQIMAHLKAQTGIETRIGVGVGTLSHCDPAKITFSMGQACDLSQKALKSIGKAFNLVAVIATPQDILHIPERAHRQMQQDKLCILSMEGGYLPS